MKLNFLFVIFLALLLTSIAFGNPATPTSCGHVNNDLVLTSNIYAQGTCFIINKSDITLNGNGNLIYGNTTGYGVYANGFNITIKNLLINNFDSAIGTEFVNGLIILNNTITTNSTSKYAIFIGNGSSVASLTAIKNVNVTSNNIFIYGIFGIRNTYGLNVSLLYNNITNNNYLLLEPLTFSGKSGEISYNNLTINVASPRPGIRLEVGASFNKINYNNILFRGTGTLVVNFAPPGGIVLVGNNINDNNFTGNFINISLNMRPYYGFYFYGIEHPPQRNYFFNNKIDGLDIFSYRANAVFYNLTLINKSAEATFSNITIYQTDYLETKGNISTYNESFYVNSTRLPQFNVSTEISFPNYNYVSLDDFNIYRVEGTSYTLDSSTLCLEPQCVKISSSPVKFKVNSFSRYIISNATYIPPTLPPYVEKPITTMLKVLFKQGNDIIFEVNQNYSDYPLNLSGVNISKQSASATKAYIIINGLELQNNTKTLYLNRLNTNLNYVCIKDAEIKNILEISKECNSDNEYLVPCNGNNFKGYTCSKTDNYYIITGLKHSAVMEYDNTIKDNFLNFIKWFFK